MTQSLIVFAVLQFASLAIICAFAALESLRSGPGRLRDKLQAKPMTHAAEPARKRAAIPQVRRAHPSRRQQRRTNWPGWPKPSTVASTLRREPNHARELVATSQPWRAT